MFFDNQIDNSPLIIHNSSLPGTLIFFMKKIYLALWVACGIASGLPAQPVIYNDAATLITGTWSAAGTGGTATLSEVTGETPYEGTKHYKFVYNFQNWWAGVGLNLDNWGNNPARNFSGYSHLRIAYRGMSSGQTLRIVLRNGNEFGNTIDIGPNVATYGVVDMSMLALTAGTNVSPSAVREVDVSVSSTVQTGSGTVYFDAISLVNTTNTPAPASAATNARAASLGLGVNTSNWLEAFWLLPFGTYPEVNKYTRTKVRDLHDAGFATFRMPVIFERLGSTSPPYALDFGHTAFALVDSMILWADLYDFKLVIDNHHGYELTDANYATELPRLMAVWTQLADEYGDLDPERYFFEVYNEPTNTISNGNFRIVADSLLGRIRASEAANGHSTHSVFVGANQWNGGNALLGFTPTNDEDVIYTFHNYDPYFFTHQGMSWTNPPYFPPRTFPQAGEVAAINSLFAAVEDWGASYSVPVSLGEFGCSTAADATSRCNWVQTLATAANTNQFSHFYWDAISPTDAFGFYTGGVISQATCIPCFRTALGLYLALPLELEEFGLACHDNQTYVNWVANAEGDAQTIEIERSSDGTTWKTIATQATQPGRAAYRHIDAASSGYYRLRMVAQDGQVGYSPVRRATCADRSGIRVYPNPMANFGRVEVAPQQASLTEVALLDLTGRVVWRQVVLPTDEVRTFSVPAYQLPAGSYVLAALCADGSRWHEPVVIVRGE
jgi:endoglucanase